MSPRKTPKQPEDDPEADGTYEVVVPPALPASKAPSPAPLDPDNDPKARLAIWSAVSPTGFERKVWSFLGKENNPWGFLPQQILFGYVIDFYSLKYLLVIEADGPSHNQTRAEDNKRDADLRKHGIQTLRLDPGDFVQYTNVQLFDLIEEFASPKHMKKD